MSIYKPGKYLEFINKDVKFLTEMITLLKSRVDLNDKEKIALAFSAETLPLLLSTISRYAQEVGKEATYQGFKAGFYSCREKTHALAVELGADSELVSELNTLGDEPAEDA